MQGPLFLNFLSWDFILVGNTAILSLYIGVSSDDDKVKSRTKCSFLLWFAN